MIKQSLLLRFLAGKVCKGMETGQEIQHIAACLLNGDRHSVGLHPLFQNAIKNPGPCLKGLSEKLL